MLLFTRRFYTADVNPLLKLAIPLALTGVTESANPFFVTMFLADMGQQELAAGALVRGLFFTLMVILWGALTAMSILVAQKHGEKNDAAVAQILRDGSILACLLTPPTFLLLWCIAPIFLLFGQNETVVTLAQEYLHALAWGILPDFLGLVLIQFLIGLGHTRAALIFMVLWTPLSVFLTYIFIFGYFGLPEFGIAGIGWGATISYWISTALLVLYLIASKTYNGYIKAALTPQKNKFLKELLQIGLPLGAMYCLEVGFFFVLTLAMGLIAEVQLAANQITMQYLGILIAVVFSIAQAVTVRMGHKIGEKDIRAADQVNKAGIFLAVAFMSIVAIFYLFFPNLLISVDLNISDSANAEIITYAKYFFIFCAFFQLFEAARISLMGSLRAFKDTRYTLLSSLVGFWFVPIPIAYVLVQLGMSGASLWIGMTTGAMCSMYLLHKRYQAKLKAAI